MGGVGGWIWSVSIIFYPRMGRGLQYGPISLINPIFQLLVVFILSARILWKWSFWGYGHIPFNFNIHQRWFSLCSVSLPPVWQEIQIWKTHQKYVKQRVWKIINLANVKFTKQQNKHWHLKNSHYKIFSSLFYCYCKNIIGIL